MQKRIKFIPLSRALGRIKGDTKWEAFPGKTWSWISLSKIGNNTASLRWLYHCTQATRNELRRVLGKHPHDTNGDWQDQGTKPGLWIHSTQSTLSSSLPSPSGMLTLWPWLYYHVLWPPCRCPSFPHEAFPCRIPSFLLCCSHSEQKHLVPSFSHIKDRPCQPLLLSLHFQWYLLHVNPWLSLKTSTQYLQDLITSEFGPYGSYLYITVIK